MYVAIASAQTSKVRTSACECNIQLAVKILNDAHRLQSSVHVGNRKGRPPFGSGYLRLQCDRDIHIQYKAQHHTTIRCDVCTCMLPVH